MYDPSSQNAVPPGHPPPPPPQQYQYPNHHAPANYGQDILARQQYVASQQHGQHWPQQQQQQQQQPRPINVNVDVHFSGSAAPAPVVSPLYSTRSGSSHHSYGNRSQGSQSLGSLHGGGPAVLYDKTFAPPPSERPQSLEVAKSQYFHQHGAKEVRSTLPSFGSVTHAGNCMARFSLKSMLIKKWRQTYWISYGYNQILFYRSKNDFDEWISNPYLSKEERDKLVKLKVDFSNDRHMPNVQGYTISKLSQKAYNRDGYMSHFKLEKWYTYGPSVLAALGGRNEHEVQSLRVIMSAMMELHPQATKFKEHEDVSSYYDSSDVGGSRRSGSISTYSGNGGYGPASASGYASGGGGRGGGYESSGSKYSAYSSGKEGKEGARRKGKSGTGFFSFRKKGGKTGDNGNGKNGNEHGQEQAYNGHAYTYEQDNAEAGISGFKRGPSSSKSILKKGMFGRKKGNNQDDSLRGRQHGQQYDQESAPLPNHGQAQYYVENTSVPAHNQNGYQYQYPSSASAHDGYGI